MIIGKVKGTLVATRKNENLIGNKFMIVEVYEKMKSVPNEIVAIDNVGAGIGDVVLIATGSAARIGCKMETAPVDAAIVGIIDNREDFLIKSDGECR